MALRRMSSRTSNGLSRNADSALEAAAGIAPKREMVLPFTPLAMSFDEVNYYVDMPAIKHDRRCFHVQVVRLIYTNSGLAVLALASNTGQKLWKWQRSDRNPSGKDKVIEILSRLCQDQPVILGDATASTSGCISSIAKQLMLDARTVLCFVGPPGVGKTSLASSIATAESLFGYLLVVSE